MRRSLVFNDDCPIDIFTPTDNGNLSERNVEVVATPDGGFIVFHTETGNGADAPKCPVSYCSPPIGRADSTHVRPTKTRPGLTNASAPSVALRKQLSAIPINTA